MQQQDSRMRLSSRPLGRTLRLQRMLVLPIITAKLVFHGQILSGEQRWNNKERLWLTSQGALRAISIGLHRQGSCALSWQIIHIRNRGVVASHGNLTEPGDVVGKVLSATNWKSAMPVKQNMLLTLATTSVRSGAALSGLRLRVTRSSRPLVGRLSPKTGCERGSLGLKFSGRTALVWLGATAALMTPCPPPVETTRQQWI